ncbi:MAG: 16S rRNA (uracil(1498)-N(3))-methyltransferase [Hoylesella marshii]|uniref:16S rRNA (uracil(1498)-N(3))-methyltransferase n=1 Tax=Hoylesella marshii TaxID=189722 RepID=UPI003F9F911D
MKEVRFFYVPDAVSQTELPQEEAVHALRVLRLNVGDEIFLMDGKGVFFRAEVSMTSSKHCSYVIKESMPQCPAWRGHIHLAIAPTKMTERMEWMTEKATEVGFDALTFLHCQYSERKTLRTDRMERIAISAMKQSRKAWLPAVHPLTPFKDFIAQPHCGRKFICHCYDEIDRKDFFTEISREPVDDADCDVCVLIGPEGDFSLDEVKQAIGCGFVSVSLGQSRLRTETAGLSAVMMAQLARRIQSH